MTCDVEGCERDQRGTVPGLRVCGMHRSRWYRHGSFEPTRKWSPRNNNPQPCKVEDCAVTEDGASGYCKRHGTRLRRHGDPTAFVAPADRNFPTGEGHPHWTGDRATYHAAHLRVARRRGPAKRQRCVDCGLQARQWSYTRESSRELTSEEGPYSPDPADYVPRCIPCHKRFDLARIRGDHDRA
jgi:hypothetical protein